MNSLPAGSMRDGRNVLAAVRLERRVAAMVILAIVVVVGSLDVVHSQSRTRSAQTLKMARLASRVWSRVRDEEIALGSNGMLDYQMRKVGDSATRAQLSAAVDSLVMQSGDDSTQHARAQDIQVAVEIWMSHAVVPVVTGRQLLEKTPIAVAVRESQADSELGAIRGALQQLRDAQDLLFAERSAAERWSDDGATIALALGLTVLTFILWIFGRRITSQTTDLVNQQEHLELQAVELEEQTAAVERQALESRALAEQLTAANQLLGDLVTRAEHAQVDLTVERRFLRQVIDANPHFIYAKDRSGRFTLVNQAVATFYGTSIEKLIGHSPSEFSSSTSEVAAFRKTDLEVMDTLKPLHIAEGQVTDSRGVVHTVQTVKCPIVGADGRAEQVLGVTTDVTEQKRLETELVHAHKLEAVGRLAGGVAHDFNNMLTAIKSYSELLRDALEPGDERRSDAEEITKAADRAAVLTRQLLAFGRRQILEPRVLDVNRTVTEVQQMLRRLLVGDVVFVTDLSPGLWPVMADAGQLEQVLINLVVNSRDAMPDGGTLTIHTENAEVRERRAGGGPDTMPPGCYVRLSVNDTGMGIDAETQGRIFEPFFTTKESGKGTGLGLATVYGIVRQSAGYVEVESTMGEGTTFSVYLPKSVVAGDARALPASAVGLRRARTETILVVDDDVAVRGVVRRILEGGGYRVVEAENGATAIEAAESDPAIGVLVTDMVMPEMGGRELALALRGSFPDIAVLLMSGYANAPMLRTEIEDTGFAFIEKPFTASALLQAVAELLAEPATV
jgi:two-component system, cell cycle sensor histidine kinase and response regulator CckA